MLIGASAGVIAVAAVIALMDRPRYPSEPFLQGAPLGAPVRLILERSCADCHSDATRYPWYSFLPVVSKTIENDVARGREQLNFSRWAEYSRLRQQRALTGIANQVKDGLMPLSNYVLLHPSAKLSEDDVDAVFKWAQQERLRLILQGAGRQP